MHHYVIYILLFKVIIDRWFHSSESIVKPRKTSLDTSEMNAKPQPKISTIKRGDGIDKLKYPLKVITYIYLSVSSFGFRNSRIYFCHEKWLIPLQMKMKLQNRIPSTWYTIIIIGKCNDSIEGTIPFSFKIQIRLSKFLRNSFGSRTTVETYSSTRKI